MKEGITCMLTVSGFGPAYGAIRRKLTGSQVAILMYHRVAPAEDNGYLSALSTDAFTRQLAFLTRNYEIISLERLVLSLATGDWPRKAIAITFDDGYKDNFRNAFPLLKKYNVPATVFLTTGCIDTGQLLWFDRVGYALWHTSREALLLEPFGQYHLGSAEHRVRARNSIVKKLKAVADNEKRQIVESLTGKCAVSITADQARAMMMSWEEVREMAAAGITFGAHGVTHAILNNINNKQAKWEIEQSKKDIEDHIRIPVTAFAYPNGNFNTDLIDLVRSGGFNCAVSSRPCVRRRLLDPGDNPFALSRIETQDLYRIRLQLSGLVGDAEKVIRPRRKFERG